MTKADIAGFIILGLLAIAAVLNVAVGQTPMPPAPAPAPAEMPYPNGPNIWVVRTMGWIHVYKFQDGPNDCYITHNSNGQESMAMSCVKR